MNAFRFFISSVQDEFAEERRRLKEWLTTDLFVSRFVESVFLFEDEPSRGKPPREVFLEEAKASDIYIGLVGTQYYGKTSVKRGVSATEQEYDAAGTCDCERWVYLKAVEGKDKTCIVGKWGSSSTTLGSGFDGIRCVYVGSSASGTVVEGFTLEKGSGFAKDDGGAYATRDNSHGGALYVYGKARDTYLVDCKIVSSTSNYGGAMNGGTAIRCVFVACQSKRGASVFNGSLAFACAVTRCTSSSLVVGTNSVIVGCSIVANDGSAIGSATKYSSSAYNCIFAKNGSPNVDPAADTHNCYQGPSATNVAFATGFDDYRLFSDSPALEVAGNPAYKQVLVDLGVPEKYLEEDLAGNIIDWSKEVMLVGAVQGTATPATATVVFDGKTIVDGHVVHPDMWICAERFPTSYELKPADSGKTLFGFKHDPVEVSASGKYVRPSWDFLLYSGVARIIPPKRSTFLQITYTPKYAAADLWVDPTDAGSDEDGDGTALKPFHTLQKAVDSVAKDLTVIHAKPGDYNEGGKKFSGLMSRVSFQSIGSKAVLLKAEEGSAVTTIWGAADPEMAEDETLPGCGTNAVPEAVSSLSLRNFSHWKQRASALLILPTVVTAKVP